MRAVVKWKSLRSVGCVSSAKHAKKATHLRMLWPLFKRRRREGFWAVQASEICRLWLVCLGAGLRVAWGIGTRGSNDSRVSKDPLRDVAGSLGRPEIRAEIGASG